MDEEVKDDATVEETEDDAGDGDRGISAIGGSFM